MTLANDLKTAFVNNTSWEDMEKLSRERFMDELFDTAASLFDSNTTLRTDFNEYARGVVELVQRVTGSDDKDDVASIISERTATGHLLTAADFGTGINGDLLYIGPLAEAQEFICKNDNTVDTDLNSTTRLWRVELSDGNSFGVADTLEMAWRYAMGAEFGPIDDEFKPFRLTVK